MVKGKEALRTGAKDCSAVEKRTVQMKELCALDLHLTLLNILMVIMVTGSRSSCSFVGIEEIYLVDFFNAKNFLIHTIERCRRMLNNRSNAKFTCLFIQNYSKYTV
ncbi:hypothetical protein T09_8856 [Trichinella sp. T9]|nr:hypothetical protein T09_8856 [Trichinella sp. T9]